MKGQWKGQITCDVWTLLSLNLLHIDDDYVSYENYLREWVIPQYLTTTDYTMVLYVSQTTLLLYPYMCTTIWLETTLLCIQNQRSLRLDLTLMGMVMESTLY